MANADPSDDFGPVKTPAQQMACLAERVSMQVDRVMRETRMRIVSAQHDGKHEACAPDMYEDASWYEAAVSNVLSELSGAGWKHVKLYRRHDDKRLMMAWSMEPIVTPKPKRKWWQP